MKRQLLVNKSFEFAWEDNPTGSGGMNQRPTGWHLKWVMPGQTLPASSDRASIIPEIVHKGEEQLPPDEWIGGRRALITDGKTVLKIFGTGAFGVYLWQQVRVTQPEIEVAFDFCIETTSPDPWVAEIGVAINDNYVYWINAGNYRQIPGNRMKTWRQTVELAGDDDYISFMIVMKAKWPVATDFFLDNVRIFEARKQDWPNPEPPPATDWEEAYRTLVGRVQDIRDDLNKILNGDGDENY